MKKITSLLFASMACGMICFSVTHAQEKLWGIQNGSVFSMNTDGSDRTPVFKEELVGNYGGAGLHKETDGFLYGFTSDTHTFYRFDESNNAVISIFQFTEGNVLDYLMDAHGVLFILAPSGLFSVHSDGTNFHVLNTFENSGIIPMTITDGDDGWIYGTADRGQFRYGAIWKVRKVNGAYQKIHDFFYDPDDIESRPTGRMFVNSEGFLVGLLQGAARHSDNAFYRLKKDGTEFSYAESKLSNINSGIILYASDKRIYFYGNVGYPEGLNTFFSADENGNNRTALYTYPLETPAELTNIIELPDGKICGIGRRWEIGNFLFITLSKDGSNYHEADISSQTLTSAGGSIALGSNGKIYGIASNTVYNVDSNGDDLQSQYEFGRSELGGPTSFIVKGENTIYGLNFSTLIAGILFKITSSEVSKVYDVSVDESNDSPTSLVEGSDDFIYGVGDTDWGWDAHIFRVHPNGSEYQSVKLHLPGFTGAKLTRLSTGEIYGVALGAGSSRRGIIFKIRSNFTGVDILYNFSDANGKVPMGALLEGSDGFLYGTTRTGGSKAYGVIYKVLPNGQQYTKLHEFNSVDGRFPDGGLVQDLNGYLYGVTPEGGRYKKGLLYRIKADGSEYTILYHFDGIVASGPFGQLFQDQENFLYGVTKSGSVYKIKNDGTAITKMLEGGYPQLYFSTRPLQANIIVINPADGSAGVDINPEIEVTPISHATNYTLQISELQGFDSLSVNFQNSKPVFNPSNLKYGTTYYVRAKTSVWPWYGETTSFTTRPGPNNPIIWGIDGNVVFHMESDGNGFEPSFLFKPFFVGGNNNDYSEIGYDPTFIAGSEQMIFGIQSTGSSLDGGCIFKMDAKGISKVHDLREDESTRASLVDAGDGYVYGIGCATGCDGINIFKFTIGGNQYQENRVLEYGMTTYSPLMVSNDHEVFGMSSGGGAFNRGFIFKIRDDLTGIDIIHSFSGVDGKAPTTSLVEGENGFLYGITSTGGTYNYGVIFKIKPDGSEFTKLHDFSSSKIIGSNPIGNLVYDNEGFLYGICAGSGKFKKGMIFKIGTDGTGYSVLYSFNGISSTNPKGDLILHNGNLYGSANAQVFSIKTDGSSFTVLHSGTEISSKLFFVQESTIQPDIYLTTPGNGNNQSYSFFAAAIRPVQYSLKYTIEISTHPEFDTLAFTGSSVSNDGSFTEIPVINVYNLDHNTTYYARARSTLWPYFGPVTSFTTLPAAPRLFGLTTQYGPGDILGIGGGSIFSIEPDGSNFIKHRDYQCWIYPGQLGILSPDLVKGDNNDLYGISHGITSPDGELFKLDLKGNFTSISRNVNLTNSVSFMQATDHNFYILDSYSMPNQLQRVATDSPPPIFPSVFFDFDVSQGYGTSQIPIDLNDGYLYGISSGGTYNYGVLYRVSLEGADFEVMYNFDQFIGGKIVDGKDGFLYGSNGGFYKIRPDGTDYEAFFNFSDTISNILRFVLSGDTLYGIALANTEYPTGAVFKVGKDGSGFQIYIDVDQNALELWNNIDYESELTSDGQGHLFGIAPFGGEHNLGFLYRLNTNEFDFQNLHSFTSETGGDVFGGLLFIDPAETLQTRKPPFSKRTTPHENINQPIGRKEIVRVFPNPFSTTIRIEKVEESESSCQVAIIDVTGKVLETEDISSKKECSMGANVPSGMYVVRVVQGRNTSVFRVIKK